MPNKGTCKAQNCDKEARAKGYCDRHYRKWRKGLMGKPRYRTCVQEGCRKPRARRSLCLDHFGQVHGKKSKSERQAAGAAAGGAPAAS
jgi:hypothetical protein